MPIKRMARLKALLALAPDESPGDAVFEMGFSHDEQGLVIIRIGVEATLPLLCQRSLEPYREPVDRHSTLVVIEDASQEDSIPESYEPVLVEDRRVALLDLVEEELLLAVPQVPRRPGSERIELSTEAGVQSASAETKEPTHRPFEGLAGLLNEKPQE